MLITHRIALDPTNKQRTLLRQHARYAHFAWNWGVAESRRALDDAEPSATRQQRIRPLFNSLKAELAPWSGVLSQNAAKYALVDLCDAWDQFRSERHRAKKGDGKRKFRPPRFESRKRAKASFRANNGPGTVSLNGKAVRLPRTGEVRMREACRFEGPVRECTVNHEGVRWHAVIACEIPEPEARKDGAAFGVDVGLRRLATVHDGTRFEGIENPRPLRAALVKLSEVNRRIARSRKVHGMARRSNCRERMHEERRRLCARVSDLRLDAAHNATTQVGKRSRLVCVESLQATSLMRERC